MRGEWKTKMKACGELLAVFTKIGPSTFGGGYAMMPVIEREIVGKRQWLDEAEMATMMSLAGSAPGGVAVNSAAFVGYRKAGIAGAIASVAGITLPALVFVIALSAAYMLYGSNPKLDAAMKGIHGAVIALIVLAAYRMAKAAVIDKTTAGVAIATVLLQVILKINPIYIIAAGLFAGMAIVKGKELLGRRTNMDKMPSRPSPQELFAPEYYI
ncbi:chromate transporter [Paenibacillus lycopersici]|uniref:Chromate transporter n=1 Tax=Paenibacillus lycopersici TaxID=2704462 RepID=A0A6C0FZU1_9BACL|nr:chromate transporter [Paenibacillus lycopersici]QHT61043.1 chromate transporter [Paenibacillus lycopersici]